MLVRTVFLLSSDPSGVFSLDTKALDSHLAMVSVPNKFTNGKNPLGELNPDCPKHKCLFTKGPAVI